MKNLGAALGVIAFVIAWGLLGAAQADKVGYACEAEVGPLCFVWEKNAIGKAGDAIEKAIDDAGSKSP